MSTWDTGTEWSEWGKESAREVGLTSDEDEAAAPAFCADEESPLVGTKCVEIGTGWPNDSRCGGSAVGLAVMVTTANST